MTSKNEDKLLEVLWTKSIIYLIITIFLITFVIIAPKKVFRDNMAFFLATSMAITTEDNLMLYDYKVYGSEERFNEGLIEDVEEVKLDFLERNEIVAVKIHGSNNMTDIRDDSVFITSTDTPELNIEYYLVKDMEFNDINLPCRTFIMLFQDISRLINTIYLAIFFVFSISIFIPISIKLARNISYLTKHYKQKRN